MDDATAISTLPIYFCTHVFIYKNKGTVDCFYL